VANLDVSNLLAYCASLAGEFEARRNRVRHFVQHNLTSGTANEAILRAFLGSISAGVYGVTDGFVCNPVRGQASKQCDILVYDHRLPVVYAESGVTIVWPESALMTIEVKTSMMGRADLEGAVENVSSVKRLDGSQATLGLVFAFDSLAPETALSTLAGLPGDPHHRPVAILLFQQGAIIQQANLSNVLRFGGGDSPYELRRCVGQSPSALVLTYLLLLFLRPQFQRSPGFAGSMDLWVAAEQFLNQHTALVPAGS
jgi:hypothetical protein